jgi:hypothetical protein
VQVTLRKVEIEGRLFEILMSQEQLNGALVGAIFEQVVAKQCRKVFWYCS